MWLPENLELLSCSHYIYFGCCCMRSQNNKHPDYEKWQWKYSPCASINISKFAFCHPISFSYIMLFDIHSIFILLFIYSLSIYWVSTLNHITLVGNGSVKKDKWGPVSLNISLISSSYFIKRKNYIIPYIPLFFKSTYCLLNLNFYSIFYIFHK